MLLLRYIVLFVMGYYLFRFLGRLLSGKKKDRTTTSGSDGKKRTKSDYTGITDQKVDDADYEEL